MKLFLLMVKNLRRNLLRTILTGLGAFVLVTIVTVIWTVLFTLRLAMTERAANLKAIVSDKWRLPSRMPYAYAGELEAGAARQPDDVKPIGSMTWTFFGGTLDLSKKSFRDGIFGFAMEPKKCRTMMDDLDSLDPNDPETKVFDEAIEKLTQNRQGLILGQQKLDDLGKRIGDRFTLYSLNYKDIALEFEIVGTFPPKATRYRTNAIFNRDYIVAAMDDYKAKKKQPHPLAEGILNLVWLKMPTKDEFESIAEQVTTSPSFQQPAVKCETASAGVAAFIEPYKDLLWGVEWLLTPAIIVTLALITANAIGINVRERRPEMAVMKVLGFGPNQILALVVGEALLLGLTVGIACGLGAYFGIKNIPFPIAFFPRFDVPVHALWWGPMLGGGTALLGALLPAWNARNTRVTDVFSKVA